MKRFIASTGLALSLAAILVLPVAGDASRPVQLRFDGIGVDVAQRCGPNALTLGFDIEGVGTHFGRFSGSGTNCTLFTLGTQAVPIYEGIVVLEAADGSTITTSYEGGQGAPAGGVATFSQAHTIVAGTGRFAGATGELTVTGTINLANLTVSGTATGWLLD
jgi:hypothetical protein